MSRFGSRIRREHDRVTPDIDRCPRRVQPQVRDPVPAGHAEPGGPAEPLVTPVSAIGHRHDSRAQGAGPLGHRASPRTIAQDDHGLPHPDPRPQQVPGQRARHDAGRTVAGEVEVGGRGRPQATSNDQVAPPDRLDPARRGHQEAAVLPARCLLARYLPARRLPARRLPARRLPARCLPVRRLPVRRLPVRRLPVRRLPAQGGLAQPQLDAALAGGRGEPAHVGLGLAGPHHPRPGCGRAR